MNLAACVDAYRLVLDPGGIEDIAILVGKDEQDPEHPEIVPLQYLELAMIYTEGAIDQHQLKCLSHDLNLDLEDEVLTPGVIPVHRMSAKLRTPQVSVGRRSVL